MTKESFSSVWDAICDAPAEAEHMKIRSALMIAIDQHIRSEGLTQSKAAKLFGVTQPRISDLMRGKIDLFSIDTLIDMAVAAGMKIELNVAKAA